MLSPSWSGCLTQRTVGAAIKTDLIVVVYNVRSALKLAVLVSIPGDCYKGSFPG